MNLELRLPLPLIISVLGVVAALVLFQVLSWISRRCQGDTPLTRDLLRGPGHSIRRQLDNVTVALMADFASLTVVSAVAGLAFALVDRPNGAAWTHGAILVLFIAGLGFFGYRLRKNWHDRLRLRLALDGEMATGEELSQLMLHGCRVFHDFPADRFNIDHVVVGPGGVLAVETKARSKPKRGSGDRTPVIYDGHVLAFPGRQEREPLEQAVRQAKWLERWLTSAIGEPIHVKPVLALPGWYVDRKGTGHVLVVNPREAMLLAKTGLTTPLPTPSVDTQNRPVVDT